MQTNGGGGGGEECFQKDICVATIEKKKVCKGLNPTFSLF